MLGILLELSTSVGPVLRALLVRRSSWMTMKLVRAYMHRRTIAFYLFSQHSGCELNGCREYPRVGSGAELNTARYQCVIPYHLPYHICKGKSRIILMVWYYRHNITHVETEHLPLIIRSPGSCSGHWKSLGFDFLLPHVKVGIGNGSRATMVVHVLLSWTTYMLI